MRPNDNDNGNDIGVDSSRSPLAGSVFDRQIARIAVGGYVDAQEVRKSTMSRVRDIVRKKNEEIPFDVVESEKDDDERDWESEYEDDDLPDLIDRMLSVGRLTEREHQYIRSMLDAADTAAEAEQQYKNIFKITESEPIYTEWLQHVYGVSTTLTAKLIHAFGYCGPVRVTEVETGEVLADERRDGFGVAADEYNLAVEANRSALRAGDEAPYKTEGAPRVSNLWSYAGLVPGQERRRGERMDYDPEARTLVWNVADSLIKQGKRSEYRRRFYDPYKSKQVRRMERVDGIDYEIKQVQQRDHTVPATFHSGTGERLFTGTPPKSDGHADERARRYLSKKFLKAYWYIGRDLQGLEVPDEWVITHGGHDKREDTFENPEYQLKVLHERARKAEDDE